MTQTKMPPMPKDPAKLKIWLERLRAQVESAKYEVDMARIVVDGTKIETERLAAVAERHKIASLQEKNTIEMDKLRMDLEKQKYEQKLSGLAAVAERHKIASLQEKNTIEMDKLRMDLEKQKYEQKLNAALASNALVYSFYSGVYEDTVANAVKTIDEWSRVHPGKDINIQLTSPGGSVLDGLALYDFLRSLSAKGHKIIVTCFGECASMGSILLQAGDERKMGENSYIMLHEVSALSYGKTSELEDSLAFINILQDRLIRILCARSKLTPKVLQEMWRKKDIWIDAKKSVKLGLVDSIIK